MLRNTSRHFLSATLALMVFVFIAWPSYAAVKASTSTIEGAIVDGGSLVLEASSSHVAIQIYWEDADHLRTSYRAFAIIPDPIGAGDLVNLAWRVGAWSEGDVPKTAARQNAERGWEGSVNLINGTPDPAVQYTIVLSPEQRAAVLVALDNLTKATDRIAPSGGALPTPDKDSTGDPLVDFARAGVKALLSVVSAANFRLEVSAGQSTAAYPQLDEVVSPLSWLYELMLLNSGGGGGVLAGCAVNHRFKGVDWADPDQAPGAIMRMLREVTKSSVTAGKVFTVPIYSATEAISQFKDYLDANQDQADLLPVGHFDPVMLDILDCWMQQSMAGSDALPRSIVERSQIYRAFDRHLATLKDAFPGASPPRFFEAAHAVTRPLGVGFVDLIDLYPQAQIENVWWVLFGTGDVFGLVEYQDGPLPPYSQETRDVLRTLNLELFKLNRGVMRKLLERPGRIFDPLGTSVPATASFSKSMAFDLRMVVLEQSLIRKHLNDTRLASNAQLMSELTSASRVLPGLAIERVFGPKQGGAFDHLAQIRTVFAAVDAAGKMAGYKRDFADFRYRVAIGSAYIFLLHDISLDGAVKGDGARLGEYLKTLFRDLERRPKTSAGRKLDDELQRLRAAPPILGPISPDPKSAGAKLLSGLSAFLDPNAHGRAWLDCDPATPGRAFIRPASSQAIGDVEARRSFLAENGLAGAIMAFELAPQGGAMDGAINPPEPYTLDICGSIQKRRAALDCTLSATDQDACRAVIAASVLTPAAGEQKDRLFLLEESQGAKAEASQVAPYLAAGLAGEDDLRAALNKSRRAVSEHARALALYNALQQAGPEAVSALNASITQADIDAIAAARPDFSYDAAGGMVDDPQALSLAESSLSLDGRRATIERENAALQPLIAKLDDFYQGGDSLAEAEELSAGPAEDGIGRETLVFTPEVPVGSEFDPLSTLAGTGVEIDLKKTGYDAEGVPIYTADLVYRRASNEQVGRICDTGGGEECAAGGTVAPGVETIPLGLSVHNVLRLAAGGFKASASRGENDITFDRPTAIRALHRLGFPTIFGVGSIDVAVTPEIDDVSISFRAEVGGLDTGTIVLPVIRDAKVLDLEQMLEEAVMAKIAAIDLGKKLGTLRLPTIGTEGSGLWLAPQTEGASITLDWKAQTLSGTISYAIGYDKARLKARATLLANEDGIAVRQMTFASDIGRAFQDAVIAKVMALDDRLSDINLVPEYAEGKLSFAVSANVAVNSCKVPVVLRLAEADFTDPKALVTKLFDAVGEGGGAIATCVANSVADDLLALLQGKKLALFGIELGIDNAEGLLADLTLNAGLAELPLALTLSDTCDPAIGRHLLKGISILRGEGTWRVSLKNLDEPSRRSLGGVVECRLAKLIAPGSKIEVSEFELGDDTASALIVIHDLPWLGDISLGRFNFSALSGSDPAGLVGDAMKAAVQQKVMDLLIERYSSPVSFDGIGEFTLRRDGTEVVLFGDDAHLTLAGTVDIQGVKAVARLVLPFKGLPGTARVDIDVEESLLTGLLGVIGDSLPFGGENVQVTAPRVEKLHADGLRYGIVFGISANFGFGTSGGFKVELRRIEISDAGIKLAGQIRMRLGIDLEFGYFALTNITVIYDTGSEGGQKGLILQTDVAPFTSALAYVIKLEGALDLRELDSKRFTMDAALVLLNSLDLMVATGTVDLGKNSVSFDAHTASGVDAIIDIQGTGEFDGEKKLATARTYLGLLGIRLQESRLLLCAKECAEGADETMQMSVYQNLLIGDADITGSSKLDFSEPHIGAGVALNLFGWKPASANLTASLQSAVVSLRFIGIKVTVITPTIDLMSPELLLGILKDLLDIDLKSLLKLKLTDVTVSLMHGSGKVSTHNGSDDGGNGNGSGGGNDGGTAEAPVPGADAPNSFTNPPPDPEQGYVPREPQVPGINEGFGDATVQAIYCEKVFGKPGAWSAEEGDRFQFWVYEKRDNSARLYDGHTHPSAAEADWHEWTFDAVTAAAICKDAVNPVRALATAEFSRVGVGRRISYEYGGCYDNTPAIGLNSLIGEDAKDTTKFVTSYKPVLCWRSDAGEIYDMRLRLLHSAGQFFAMVECPVDGIAPPEVGSDPLFARVCVEHRGLVPLGTLENATNTITAAQEFELLDVRARDVLINGARDVPRVETFPIVLEGGAEVTVSLFDLFDAAGTSMGYRVYMQAPDGTTVTGVLPQHSALVPWIRPGFREPIFLAWFSAKRVPDIAYNYADTELVLTDDDDGKPRALTWLRQTEAGVVPLKLELDSTALPRIEKSSVHDVLEALRIEVPLLTAGDPWRISLRAAPQSELRLYTMHQGSTLRILLDRLTGPTIEALPGDFTPVSRAERRICHTVESLLAALQQQLPPGSTPLTDIDLDIILTDPDAAIERYRLLAHPLLVITQPRCP